jgi:DNA-binding MarR family transcriptional regulator
MPKVAETSKQAAPVFSQDLVSDVAAKAEAMFEGRPNGNTESLQNQLDWLAAKVVRVTFETVREEFDSVIRLLRNVYGQIARFAKGDFRRNPSFYLGQLHALAEITHRLGHQRAPRQALEAVARSDNARKVLLKTVEEKSIGAQDLAKALNMKESNLSTLCKPLVEKELLRSDRFGRQVRYSPTPLTFAVLKELGSESGENDHAEPISALPDSRIGRQALASQRVATTESALEQGLDKTSNADDLVSGLLNLAVLRGATGIAIDRSGRRIRLEGTEKRSPAEVNMPPSVGQSLSEQVKAWQERRASTLDKGAVDLNGQKIEVASGGPHDSSITLLFVETPDSETLKTKAQAAFRRVQEEKESWGNLERDLRELGPESLSSAEAWHSETSGL